MDREERIGRMAQFFPKTKQGHGGLRGCRLGCELGTEEGQKRHTQDKFKMAERFLDTGTTERARNRKEVDREDHLSAEHRGFKEQATIRSFNSGDLIQIEIPFLAQKHGALKERENMGLHGSVRTVIPTPDRVSRYERLVTIAGGDKKTRGIPATWCRLIKAAS